MSIRLPIEATILRTAFEKVLAAQPRGSRWANAAWRAYREWLSHVESVEITDDAELVCPSFSWHKLSPQEKERKPKHHKATVHVCDCDAYNIGMGHRANPYPCVHRQAANIVEEYIHQVRAHLGAQGTTLPSLATQGTRAQPQPTNGRPAARTPQVTTPKPQTTTRRPLTGLRPQPNDTGTIRRRPPSEGANLDELFPD